MYVNCKLVAIGPFSSPTVEVVSFLSQGEPRKGSAFCQFPRYTDASVLS